MLDAAAGWVRSTGLSRATLATRAAGDGKFFDRIERGANCTMDRYDAVIAWITTDLNRRTKVAAE